MLQNAMLYAMWVSFRYPPDELVVLLGRMLRERSLMAGQTSIHLFASSWRTYLDIFALAAGLRATSVPLVCGVSIPSDYPTCFYVHAVVPVFVATACQMLASPTLPSWTTCR